jgi:hypothetical protein
LADAPLLHVTLDGVGVERQLLNEARAALERTLSLGLDTDPF